MTGRRRRPVGSGGPRHLMPMRARQKATTREAISRVVAAIADYPTPAAVAAAAGDDFSRSSVSRHVDLIHAAQDAWNRSRSELGLRERPHRRHKVPGCSAAVFEASKDRSDELARRLADVERTAATLRTENAELKLTNRRLLAALAAMRSKPGPVD